MSTVEPQQNSEKSVIIREADAALLYRGLPPPRLSAIRTTQVYDAITDILSNGRVSRLYRSLVRDQRIAAEAEGFSGFPGVKYPGLFAFYAVPLPGHTPEEMRTAIHKEIDKLKTQDVTDEELAMFKTRARVDLLRSLADNQGLAESLATYQLRYGDWRELFRQLDKIDKVSKADIRRVANKVFTESNRTYAIIETVRRRNRLPASRAAPAKDEKVACDALAGMCTCVLAAPCLRCCYAGVLVPAQQTQQAQPWKQIPIPALPPFTRSSHERIVLDNGAIIFLQEDHELPFINGFVEMRGGGRDVPVEKDRAGRSVWRCVAHQRDGKMSGDAMDDLLEAKAAKVETGGDVDSTSVSWSCLKTDFDTVFGLATDLLLHPKFDPGKLRPVKAADGCRHRAPQR